MIANAEQAIEHLRHKRTGEVLPTKVIGRNTRLVYLDDDLVGLRFHDTIIAKYMRDGVVIDTRDRSHPQGWFTMTTWERIDEWTPARTFSQNGLRYMALDPAAGWRGPLRLFAHGAKISLDGSCEIPLSQEQSDAIAHIKNSFPAKLKRHADHVVANWRDWGQPEKCCLKLGANGPDTSPERMRAWQLHDLKHVRAGQYVVPIDFEDDFVAPLRPSGMHGDLLCSEVARNYANHLKEVLIPIAIEQIAPDFPYPQLSRRSR